MTHATIRLQTSCIRHRLAPREHPCDVAAASHAETRNSLKRAMSRPTNQGGNEHVRALSYGWLGNVPHDDFWPRHDRGRVRLRDAERPPQARDAPRLVAADAAVGLPRLHHRVHQGVHRLRQRGSEGHPDLRGRGHRRVAVERRARADGARGDVAADHARHVAIGSAAARVADRSARRNKQKGRPAKAALLRDAS